MTDSSRPEYDVIVIGGALGGAATATLLLRDHPGLRLLIVEKSTRLSRRVGEATVEISAYFMGRILGLTQFLNETQLVKQGLRFWFSNDRVRNLGEASELGARYQVRLPSYLLDRATFDEEVLRRAQLSGADLLRPATVTDVQLTSGGLQLVTIKYNEESRVISGRWVVDASGVAALLARKNGWWVNNEAHPIAAAWSRWRGVKDWDSYELAQTYPEYGEAVYGIRGPAANHITGDGWWSWWIPLKGGDVSVGVVFDQRLVDWSQTGAKLGERIREFLEQSPVAKEMLANAEFSPEDVHWRRNLSYYSTKFSGDGFVLVGDASAFMDPFYSPGMDWIAFTSSCAAELINAQRRGEALSPLLVSHNQKLSSSYHRWFEAIYQDKYEYIGEFDLMSLAFVMDLGCYYLGIVSQPFKKGRRALLTPPFSEKLSRPIFYLMRAYNRRFVQIARRRRRLGQLGRYNDRRRRLISGFTFRRSDISLILRALAGWAWLELTEGWRSWGGSTRGEKESAQPEKLARVFK